MLVCPTCQTPYPDDGRPTCPRDGAGLLELDDRCGTVIGNYRILGLLGRGGMGVVYRAAHVYIDKPVAVKILHDRFARHEDAVERFLREARAATLITHPNIVDVTDFGVLPDGGVFFVMEYLDGHSLDHLIQEAAPLPLLRAINITNQIALALGAAHEKGIIHRDLKPENVIVIARPGRRELVYRPPAAESFVVQPEQAFDFVKVLDFGVAKVREIDEPARAGTLAGTVFGTPQYIAPEQARGQAVDHRADVYALGIVFYEMLTGQVPFDGQSPIDTLAMQIREQPRPPSALAPPGAEVSAAAERLIMRCLDKDPARRPQSMALLGAELQTCFGDVRYRRDAHGLAGLEPRGSWDRAPGEGGGPSRLRKKRLTEELHDLLGGAPEPGAPPASAPPPRRKRLTEELQQLLQPDSAAPAPVVVEAVASTAEVVVEQVEPILASELSSRVRRPAPPPTPLAPDAEKDLFGGRARRATPAAAAPGPRRTTPPATAPGPAAARVAPVGPYPAAPPPGAAAAPRPPGVRAPGSRTALGRAVVAPPRPDAARRDTAVPEPVTEPPDPKKA
ncbi:MAG TPA: serine/threonine-protein kinase [Polyangia bacterium]